MCRLDFAAGRGDKSYHTATEDLRAFPLIKLMCTITGSQVGYILLPDKIHAATALRLTTPNATITLNGVHLASQGQKKWIIKVSKVN